MCVDCWNAAQAVPAAAIAGRFTWVALRDRLPRRAHPATPPAPGDAPPGPGDATGVRAVPAVRDTGAGGDDHEPARGDHREPAQPVGPGSAPEPVGAGRP